MISTLLVPSYKMPPLDGSQLQGSNASRLSFINSIMIPRSGLLACSNEVLTMIFNDPGLRRRDLKALRLTSKELYPAATREFAIRYVADPVVALSEHGLQSLVDICRHPIFGPQIRSIGFLATTLHIKGLEQRVTGVERGHTRHKADYVCSVISRLVEISDYAKTCKKQLQLEASGDIERLLVEAFEAVDHPISIAITNDLESVGPIAIIGLPTATYRYDSSDKRFTSPSDINSMMRSLFTSIEKTIVDLKPKKRMSLAGLKINIRRRFQVAASSDADCIEIRPLGDAYSNLTTLHLDLNLRALHCRVSFKSWTDLFKVAAKLQELKLSTSCTGVRAVGASTLQRVAEIFDIEAAFKLQVLVLKNVPCTSESLLQLLEKHKRTLVKLKLSRVTLVGSWQPCLSWIRKDLDLKDLHFSHPQWINPSITTGRGVSQAREYMWSTGVAISQRSVGQENVDAGLDRMILHAYPA